MTQQQTLFKEQPLRRNDGRYCTKEQYRIEQVDGENRRLRLECEKYQRMAMALGKENERLTRELIMLRSKIEGLL